MQKFSEIAISALEINNKDFDLSQQAAIKN